MPVYLKTLGYKIYFWSNESAEPIHFHIAKGNPHKNDTKIWVLSNCSFAVAHNKGKIPEKDLAKILALMQTCYFDFVTFYKNYLNEEIKFYK